jgi:hypothetical protein
MRSSASWVTNICMALKVESKCASWSGCAPNAPTTDKVNHDAGTDKKSTVFCTCLIIPATHDKIDHLVSIQCVFVPHHTQRCKTPVHRIQSQVSAQVICEVFVLFRYEVDIHLFQRKRPASPRFFMYETWRGIVSWGDESSGAVDIAAQPQYIVSRFRSHAT